MMTPFGLRRSLAPFNRRWAGQRQWGAAPLFHRPRRQRSQARGAPDGAVNDRKGALQVNPCARVGGRRPCIRAQVARPGGRPPLERPFFQLPRRLRRPPILQSLLLTSLLLSDRPCAFPRGRGGLAPDQVCSTQPIDRRNRHGHRVAQDAALVRPTTTTLRAARQGRSRAVAGDRRIARLWTMRKCAFAAAARPQGDAALPCHLATPTRPLARLEHATLAAGAWQAAGRR
jgi:hypothetical protein